MDWRGHWSGRARYVVLITRAAGADVEHWLRRWRQDPARPARLHLILAGGGSIPGARRQLQAEDAITVDVLDARNATLAGALGRLQGRIDMVCIDDSFNASIDPACVRALARLLAPDALMEGVTADLRLDAGAREALALAGWQLASQASHPLLARYASRRPAAPAPTEPERRAIVIGAGLAGAAACERLCARGWQVTLIEQHAQAAMEASGNRAGITMPMLSKDDNRASRLSRAAYLFAGEYWDRLGGVGAAASTAAIEGARCGVLLAARDADHAALQRAIAAAHAWPPGYAQWLEAGADAVIPALDGARFGQVAPHGAWLFQGGGWLRPASAVAAMLDACAARLLRRFGCGPVSLAREEGGWAVQNAAGAVLASAPVVVVASGGGALAQTAALPITRVRGQVTHLAEQAETGRLPDLGVVLCREAYLTPAAGGIHSIGATYDDDPEPALRQSSQEENLDHLRAMLADPGAAAAAPLAGRVGFRAVATDRLPMVGAVPDPGFAVGAERLRDLPRQQGLYALLGYASRGLTWAPLAAELLAAALDHEPLPLETDLVESLDPGRFLLRARRKKVGSLR